MKSLVVISSSSLKKFREKLLPFLRARGIFSKSDEDVAPWLTRWLESPTGFFWGTLSKRPQVGGVYFVYPHRSKPLEAGGFETWMRVGDCSAKLFSENPLQGPIGVRVMRVSHDWVDVQLCSELPETESPFNTEFRVFHTADGVTGYLKPFVGTSAMQLVDVLPNEQLPIGVVFQLPEQISVRKDIFPLLSLVWDDMGEDCSDAHSLRCDCFNCHGSGEVICKKCSGAGFVTCYPCHGKGHFPCNSCNETGKVSRRIKEEVTCPKCSGSGEFRYRDGTHGGDCWTCHGKGYRIRWRNERVDCFRCGGEGQTICQTCHGSGHLSCNNCNGDGSIDCVICRGSGTLFVDVNFKSGRFFRKHKNEISWLDAKDVFFLGESEDEKIPLAGCYTDIRQATERQMHDEEARKARSDRIVRDGETIEGCLDRVLRLSPAIVKPFEIKNPIGVPGRKAKGRVFYEFDARGDSPWLSKKAEVNSDSAEEPSDQDKALGPFSAGTHVSFDGVAVPEGKAIIYEGCDATGRKLVFSFPVEVALSSLTERKILVKADAIPPPEKREKERLGFWLENKGSRIFQGLVEGVEERRTKIKTFLNEGISRFPVQADAIRQGLSDAPVLLLKGPPGTGKTTVIVELIRQAVRQGKRVLLTSQTHQAVDNVLERLHKFRESGEDRIVRMAVYSAIESKLSDLGRQYMAGSQEGECCEIRGRVKSSLAKLEEACGRNRTIRGLLAEGASTAGAIWKRLKRRDNDLQAETAARDRDFESIKQRHDTDLANENESFALFSRKNEERMRSIKRSIELLNKAIAELEAEKGVLSRRVESGKSGFFLRLSDTIFGSHFDLQNTVKALQGTNESLSSKRAKERQKKLELSSVEEESRSRESIHETECAAIEERMSSERRSRLHAWSATCTLIGTVADNETASYRERQQICLAALVRAGGKPEASRLNPESKPEAWSADIDRLDNEFSDLNSRLKFMLDWASELKDSSQVLSHFLNAQTNVFFATCVGMGSWRALIDGTYEMRDEGIGGTGRTVFDIAIVDEAGHATFAETVVPLCSAKKVVLIGDDKQLPPMLGEDLDCRRDMDSRCDSCAVGADGRQCWYEYSMFQYLWENDKAFKLPRLMLDTQFRMHPDIADFISETFYEGRLKNGVSAEDRKFSFGSFRNPVCLLSTSSQKNRFEVWKDTSCTNPLEADLVRGIVEELASSLEDGIVEGAAGRPLSLAVITPYAAQEALLKMKLSHCYRSSGRFEFSSEDIASVDRFQGDERDVVIASFVRSPAKNLKGGRRSPRLTFVHDLKRMNVAFSRARRMLIMVGDIKALESAPGNERGRAAFAKFHEHVDKRGRQILVWERRAR